MRSWRLEAPAVAGRAASSPRLRTAIARRAMRSSLYSPPPAAASPREKAGRVPRRSRVERLEGTRAYPAGAAGRRPRRRTITASNVPRAHPLLQVIHRAPAEGQDRPRRVLGAPGDERRGIGQIHVGDIVQAAELVRDRRLRVVAHPRGADLVDGPPGGQRLAVDLDVLR